MFLQSIHTCKKLHAALLCLFMFCCAASAQTTYSFSGKIFNHKKEAVPDAMLNLSSPGGKANISYSDTGGAFKFNQLQPGLYILSIYANGYKRRMDTVMVNTTTNIE